MSENEPGPAKELSMADKENEPEDPLEFVGMAIPAGPEADAEMTRAVIEEFLLHGFDRTRLLRLFQDPFYAGTHRVWVARGEKFVEDMLDTVLREWSPAPESTT